LNKDISLKDDLNQLLDFSKEKKTDWIVTDHYGLDESYIKIIKQNNFKVLTFDDTAQMHYFSDIVLNQNINANKLNISTEKNTKLLLGPKYALIRDELFRRNEKKKGKMLKIY